MTYLENLAASVYNPQVAPLYKDAIKAYEGGAYRSALIETWVTLFTDLVSKFRFIAKRDIPEATSAKEWLDGFDGDHKSKDSAKCEKRESDKSILKRAERVGLISHTDSEQLGNLYQQRNFCAHPFADGGNYFSPEPEQVQAYLVLIWQVALSKPAQIGAILIDHFKKDMQSPYPPTGSGFADEYIRTSDKATIQQLFELIITQVIEKDDSHYIDLLPTCYEEKPKIFEEAFGSVIKKLEENDQFLDQEIGTLKLAITVGCFGHFPFYGSALSSRTKQLLAQMLKDHKHYWPSLYRSGYPSDCSLDREEKESLQVLYRDNLVHLPPETIQKLIGIGAEKTQFIDALIDQLPQSTSFSQTDSIMSRLIHLALYFTAQQIDTFEAALKNGNIIELSSGEYNQIWDSGPELRLKRIKNDSCTAHPELENAWSKCFEHLKTYCDENHYSFFCEDSTKEGDGNN